MKIQGKIFYCLFTIVLFLIVIILFTYNASTKVSFFRNRSAAVENRLLAGTALRAQVRNQLLETFDVLYVSGIKKNEERINQGKEEIRKRIADLETNLTDEGNNGDYKSDIEEIKKSYAALQSMLDQAVSLIKENHTDEARKILTEARENKFQKYFLTKITGVIEKETQVSQLESRNLEQSITWLQQRLILSATVALILSLLLSTFIARSIGLRLAGIEKAAQRIASGDFDIALPTTGKDEVSTLSVAINKMAASLLEAKNQILKQQELLVVSSKMSSLGEMAGGIAHEINTPLAVIGLRAGLLEQTAQSKDFEQNGRKTVAESTAIILKTTARIAKTIAGLRAFARDGTSDPFQESDVRVVIQDSIDLCGEKFRDKGINLQVIMPEEELLFSCRATQISQVILNLLSNSYDATAELDERWIKVEARDLGQNIEISVTDSGKGIPASIRSKITQPFFTTKDVDKGTGLGLSISRGIILDHQGRFYLDEEHTNTRFVIVLPKLQS